MRWRPPSVLFRMCFIGILVRSQLAFRIRCFIPTHSLACLHNALIASHEVSKHHVQHLETMIGENRQLVTNEPVEFKEKLIEVQECRKFTDHFRRICRIYHPNSITENRRMSTCNRLDLQHSRPGYYAQQSPRSMLAKFWANAAFESNEWGEPTATYRWAGWGWEITSWRSKLQQNYHLCWTENLQIH